MKFVRFDQDNKDCSLRVAETQAEETLKRALKDVMRTFKVQSLLGFPFCLVFAD